MADRYWVGGAGDWNNTAKWSTSSGGSGGASVPSSSDDVFINGSSGLSNTAIITFTVNNSCNNIDLTGAPTPSNGTAGVRFSVNCYLSIYDSFTGSNFRFRNASGSFTAFDRGVIFVSSGASTIDVSTLSLTDVCKQFNGTGSWTFLSDVSGAGWSKETSLIQGTIDTDGLGIRIALFETHGSATRELLLRDSIVDIPVWIMTDTTNFTLDSGTSQITTAQFKGGGLTYYDVLFQSANDPSRLYLGDSNTFNNLTLGDDLFDPVHIFFIEPSKVQTINGTLTIAQDPTELPSVARTGTLTLNTSTLSSGASDYVNTTGQSTTFDADTVDLTGVDFMDVTITGSGAPYSGTSLGNALGNSGITFSAPVNRYWVSGGVGITWSNTTNWSTTSGGASGASYPRCHDVAFFNENSFSGAGEEVYLTPICVPSMDWSAVTNSPDLKIWNIPETYLFGNQVFGTMSFTFGSAGGADVYLHSRSTANFSQNGAVVVSPGSSFEFNLFIDMPGGSLVLQDNLNLPLVPSGATNNVGFLVLEKGTFDANDFNVTTSRFQSDNTNTRSILMGNGTWTLSRGLVVNPFTDNEYTWDTTITTGLTFNTENSNLVFDSAISTSFVLGGGGLTFNNFSVSGHASSTLIVYGSNTFNNFTIISPLSTVTLEEDSTQTINSFSANGTVSNVILLRTSGTYGVITGLTIVDGGLGYTQDDNVTIVGAGSGGVYNIDSVDGSGTVTALSQVSAGSNYISGVHDTLSSIHRNGMIISGSIVAGGSDYQVGDFVFVDSGTDGYFEILTVDGGGGVTSIDLNYGGEDYTAGVHSTTFDGTREGEIISATISNGGSGYTAGDYLYVEAGVGDPDALDGYFLIDSVNGGGAITGISLDSPGELYDDGVHDVTPIDFGGSGAQIDLTVTHDPSGLTIDVTVNVFSMLTVNITATTIESFISATTTSISYLDVQNSHALGDAILFEDFPGGVDSGNNTNWCFTEGCHVEPPPPSSAIRTVFLVGSNLSGNVQLINAGSSDDSTPIYYELETQDLDFGNKFHKKDIDGKIAVFSKNAADSRLQIKTDNNSYQGLQVKLEDRVNVSRSLGYEGNKYNFKWLGNTTNVSPVFEGLRVEDVDDMGISKKS